MADSAPRHDEETSEGVAGADRLVPFVYDELRSLARLYMRGERAGHTLQPTALVHEACMRLMRADHVDWQGRSHFLAVAAREMRRILIEHARGVRASRRGGASTRIEWTEALSPSASLSIDLLSLDEALDRLSRRSPRQGRIAELKLFAGASVSETAEITGVSPRTVKSDWRVARAYLSRALRPGPSAGP